jgi:hypothetical protein
MVWADLLLSINRQHNRGTIQSVASLKPFLASPKTISFSLTFGFSQHLQIDPNNNSFTLSISVRRMSNYQGPHRSEIINISFNHIGLSAISQLISSNLAPTRPLVPVAPTVLTRKPYDIVARSTYKHAQETESMQKRRLG